MLRRVELQQHMDPKKIKNKEHHEYLELKDNPKKVSTSAIFALVSDTTTSLTKSMANISERMSVLETKQDQAHEQILSLDKEVTKSNDELDREQRQLRADFEANCTASAKTDGKFEERFTWSERMQKLILAFIISVFGFLLYIFGIPIPLP